MIEKIQIFIDSNERNSDRANGLILAAAKDARFSMPTFAELGVDVCFRLDQECPQCHGIPYPDEETEDGEPCGVICGICTGDHGRIVKIYNVELKDFSDDGKGSDYVSSIRSGHLWEQCLNAREAGIPYAICVLGDDHDIQGAIRKAAGFRPNGNMDGFDLHKFAQYSAMVDGFEANCMGLNIPVWHLGYNQFPRLLLRVRKILEGGDLSGFAPHPAENEREIVGLSILAGNGIGKKKAAAILERFSIKLESKFNPETCRGYSLIDCKGLGPKLAARIREKIEVLGG
jgi:hypothetical protein